MKTVFLQQLARLLVALAPSVSRRSFNPDDLDVVPVRRMIEFCALHQQPVEAALIGGDGRDRFPVGAFGHPQQAIAEIAGALSRARIDYVRITTNSPEVFAVQCLHHERLGQALGRHLSGALVQVAG